MKKLIAIGLVSGLFLYAGVAQASTQTVTGNTASAENQPGWLFNRDTSTQTPYQFNNDQHSIGSGSLFVPAISANASDKFIGEDFLLTPIANVNSISYDFKLGQGVSASKASQFYMNVYTNFGESDPNKFYDCRYNIVPSIGSNSAFTTVTFDPTHAYPVTQRNTSPQPCPASPAAMNNGSTTGATIRVIALNVGDTSASDAGVSGYLDNVVVDLDSGVTVSDFELAPNVVTVNPSAPEVTITNPTQPVSVTIDPGTTNATINFDSLITGGTGTLPETNIDSATADVAIPASTVVTSTDTSWNGVITAPTVVSAPAITADEGQTATAVSAIEVGAGDTPLTFSKAVKLTFAGMAGKLIGWSQAGSFHSITDACVADDQATNDLLADGTDCRIDVGGDLIVWTKHFSTFVVYTQAATVSSGTSSNIDGHRQNISNLLASNGTINPNAGQVLGAFTSADNQVQIALVKQQLITVITQLIQLLQQQLAALKAQGAY